MRIGIPVPFEVRPLSLLRQSKLQTDPGGAVRRAFHSCFDERHAIEPIRDIGVLAAVTVERLAVVVRSHVLLETAMQARIRVMESLRVTGWNVWLGHQVLGQITEEPVVGRDGTAEVGPIGLVRQQDGDLFGELLRP